MNPSPIKFWDRRDQREKEELVYGDKMVRFLYETAAGQKLAHLFSIPVVSRLYGYYQNSKLSRAAIQRFISTFQIPMDEYESSPFDTFNDFFIRRFKPGQRDFIQDKNKMAAFSEGRYLAFDKINNQQVFPVKGKYLSVKAILGNSDLANQFASQFEGGPLLISRLCPVDYHRFHFPDDGRILNQYHLDGRLHSVNPLALRYKGDIFATNERHVSFLETKNFGTLAYVEVGAMGVGKIVQTHDSARPFKRGDQKGYFLFGASTIILMGTKGKWSPDQDLLEKTSQGLETFVRLGESIAIHI